jgi:hypothetical protein
MQRKHTGRGIIPESGGLLHLGSRNFVPEGTITKRIIQGGMDCGGFLEWTGLVDHLRLKQQESTVWFPIP